jgi:type III secretion protein C
MQILSFIDRTTRAHTAAGALVMLFAAAAPPGAGAAEMVWDTRKVQYVTLQPKDLQAVIREVAAQQGVGVYIDPAIKGELAPGNYDLSARSMMELIARNFAILWYFDGRVLYVYPSTSVENAILRLGNASPSQFQRSLERLGIADSRFPLSFDGERVLVSGPKRYVELVRQVAGDVGGDSQDPGGAVRVFELKYAFAEDYTVTNAGRDLRVPGVVSILRQAFGNAGRSLGSSVRTSMTPRRPLDGASADKGDEASPADGAMTLPPLRGRREGSVAREGDDASRPINVGGFGNGAPSFAADPRTNAVIVRDTPARMEQYESVIRRLDQRPRLVELEVNIVEVNADDFSELGIDWRVVGRRGQAEVGGGGIAAPVGRPNGVPAAPPANGDPLQSLGNIAGTVLGVVAGNRNQLFMRITALEQAGKATVSAQPKVMTLNNVEAALAATNTFYVPVQGFQDAQLYDISAGTSLRITPSVVSASGPGTSAEKDMVRLLIKIEDGGLTGSNVGQLPVVQRTTINTQSLVVEGSTLLIAGYAQERESRNQKGVPGLQHVPVIGNLFKSTDKNRSRVERLFMITPRVVDLQGAEKATAVPMMPGAQDSRSGSDAVVAPAMPVAPRSPLPVAPTAVVRAEPAPALADPGAAAASQPRDRAVPTSPQATPPTGPKAAWALGLEAPAWPAASASAPRAPRTARTSPAPPNALWQEPAPPAVAPKR